MWSDTTIFALQIHSEKLELLILSTEISDKATPSDFSLFTFLFSLEIHRISKRSPFALQNESFYPLKGVLLQCKRSPFGRQKDSFLNVGVENLYF